MKNSRDIIPTKERILFCAADLFAKKGYTETTIRDLAKEVGLKGASIYSHFPSKKSILEYILDDYIKINTAIFLSKDVPAMLRENPTPEGILKCMQLTFPKEKEEYYYKVLCVLMQEQHRNPLIRNFMAEQFILSGEENIKKIIEFLKEMNVLRKDTDPDFWMKTGTSLLYAFASRATLGIGDSMPDFTGMNMAGLLKFMYEIMFKLCGTAKETP